MADEHYNDLIERLESVKYLNPEYIEDAQKISVIIDDAVAALSPVLPEEAAERIRRLKASPFKYQQETAEVFERLAREKADIEDAHWSDVNDLQARIEELEQKLNEYREGFAADQKELTRLRERIRGTG